MRSYEVKRGCGNALENGGLRKQLAKVFDGASDDGDWHVASWGALQQVTVRLVSKTEIELDSQLDTSASLEVATDTHKRFNKFLETVTGFNAKERKNRAKARAKAEAKAEAKAAAAQESGD